MQTDTAAPAGKSPRHVTAARSRQRRKLTESPAIFDGYMAARLRKQVLVTGVQIAATTTVIPPDEFGRLRIDESYQRAKITNKVNDLITVIRQGGQIPDPVDVSERPDGSWYIVDGQQRFWAHFECSVQLKAHIHRVADLAAEKRLFIALNSRQGLSPKNIIKSWTGPTGELLHRLNESDKSPLKGLIDFSGNAAKPIDASSLVKAFLILLTGVKHGGDTATRLLPRTDTALQVAGATAWVEAFVQLVCAVFGPSTGSGGAKVRVLPMVALASVAHEKYCDAGRPIFPRSTSRLRQVNWNNAVPSHATKYQGMLEDRIKRLWR